MSLKLIGIASLLAASILSSAPTTAQVRSYPLNCRGGGTMTIRNTGNNNVQISFRRAKSAVAQKGLAPGECGWSDRRFSEKEPAVICDSGRRAAEYVGRLVHSNGTVNVNVYNNRGACMQVTQLLL